jgi:hypothetical protein
MKTVIVILAALLVPASSAIADICFKQHAHTDEYYYGGGVNPAEDTDTEIWFGDQTMAYITDNRSIVIDLANQKLTWINFGDSTYAETTLPFKWSNIATAEAAAYLWQYPRKGTITATDEVKEVNGKQCTCYNVTTWIEVRGGRYNETDEKMWVTTDIALDWDTFGQMNAVLMKLQNADDDFTAAIGAVKGYPMLSDGDRFIKGFSVKTTEEVVEIIEKDPRPGLYAIPEGFTNKKKLTIEDIRG